MNRIYKQMELAREQYRVGLISQAELTKALEKLEFALMGCDSL
jgi:hypothetical protein